MSEFNYEDWLAHFNPNHDPRNGQFTKNVVGGVASSIARGAVTNGTAKVKNAAVKAKRVPERAAKIKRIAGLTAAGALTGASAALAIMSGVVGALPIAAIAAKPAIAAGTAFMGSYTGGVAGLGIGMLKESLSEYLRGDTPDAKDWDRYLRSNTNYDKLP